MSEAEAIARGIITGKEIAPKKGRSDRRDREYEEQVVVVDGFYARHPEAAEYLVGIPNGGSRKHKFEGYRLKRAGAKAGVSDLALFLPLDGWLGMWVEMKATPPHHAPVTDEQWNWLYRMRGVGYAAAVCYGAAEGLSLFDDYMHGRLSGYDSGGVIVARAGERRVRFAEKEP